MRKAVYGILAIAVSLAIYVIARNDSHDKSKSLAKVEPIAQRVCPSYHDPKAQDLTLGDNQELTVMTATHGKIRIEFSRLSNLKQPSPEKIIKTSLLRNIYRVEDIVSSQLKIYRDNKLVLQDDFPSRLDVDYDNATVVLANDNELEVGLSGFSKINREGRIYRVYRCKPFCSQYIYEAKKDEDTESKQQTPIYVKIAKFLKHGNLKAFIEFWASGGSNGLPLANDTPRGRGTDIHLSWDGQINFQRKITVPFSQYFNWQLADLEGDGNYELLTDFSYVGTQIWDFYNIYRYDPTLSKFSVLEIERRPAGISLQEIDGKSFLVTKDATFDWEYKYPQPISIWQYQRGRLIDVTRNYPKLVRKDADYLWENRYKGRGGGILAAYLACKYLLGEEEEGWRQVREAYQESDRKQFFARLESFLKEKGYAP